MGAPVAAFFSFWRLSLIRFYAGPAMVLMVLSVNHHRWLELHAPIPRAPLRWRLLLTSCVHGSPTAGRAHLVRTYYLATCSVHTPPYIHSCGCRASPSLPKAAGSVAAQRKRKAVLLPRASQAAMSPGELRIDPTPRKKGGFSPPAGDRAETQKDGGLEMVGVFPQLNNSKPPASQEIGHRCPAAPPRLFSPA